MTCATFLRASVCSMESILRSNLLVVSWMVSSSRLALPISRFACFIVRLLSSKINSCLAVVFPRFATCSFVTLQAESTDVIASEKIPVLTLLSKRRFVRSVVVSLFENACLLLYWLLLERVCRKQCRRNF